YSEIPFRTLSVGSEPEGLKIVIDSLEYTSPGSIQAREGTSHTIEFKAQERDESSFVSGIDTKYTFKSWNDSNTSNPRTVLLDSDKNYTVQTETWYLVETSTLPEGVASIDGAGWKVKDSLFSYVSPDSIGYDFSHWEVNGIRVDGRSIEITHDSPKNIVAIYTLKGYSVSVNTEPSGLEVKVNGVKKIAPASTEVNHGDTVSLEIVTPQERDESTNVDGVDSRYSFLKWSDGNTSKARTITVTGNASLTAQMKSEYLVSVGSTVATISGSGWYEKGSSLTLTAPQVGNHIFTGWNVNGETINDNPLQININSAKKVIAIYNAIPTLEIPDQTVSTGTNLVLDLRNFASDSDGDPIVFSKISGVGTISGNQFSYSAITAGTYSVTVRASDGKGGEATDTFSITVEPSNNAPLKPSNPAPSSGATGVGTSVTLSWNCSDPDGDALVYDVYFCTTTNPARVSAGQTTKSYTLSNLTEGTKYYWKVVARDSKGLETTGDLWNFTTKSNQPPAKPSSPNPANNSSDIAVSMTLSWNCSDPDGDSLKYDIYFGESSNPSKVASEITTKSYNPGNFQNGKDYYWKIVATDAKGATTQGDVWKFRTVAAEIPPEDGIDMNGPVYTGNILLVSNESESANTTEYTGTLSSDYLPSGDILPKNLPIEAYAINPEIPLPDDIDLSMKMRPDLVEAGFELAAVGSTRSFHVRNFRTNSNYQITATLQYIGETCEIWVENPSEITVSKATQLGQEFDSVIYPLVTEYFYTPSDVNGDGRVAILCFDIQDDFESTGAYVGGYFSSGDLFNSSTSNKMEIFYIDTYPTMHYPASNPVDVSRAYSTLVHEFQHMVNFNRNYFVEKGSSMPTWLNEGLSMAAEHIYKGTLTSRISYYNYSTSIKNGQSLLYWNDNGDVLANYSLSYLFLQYVRTQGGGDPAIFRDILLDSCNDQRAVTAALAKRGINIGFGDLMTAFRIALLLKKPTGLYGFRGDSSFDGITVSYYTGGAKNLRGGSAVFKTINPSFTDPGNSGSSIHYVGICK
ncbi:fibronectin type III domain-containing protein, partial [Mesotoga sp. TolDC]|uniref:fibronectin type III domain-containing protein n=1 Tax=Mesotoga sp. TolDC TaxID=1389250 RepID=UPI0015E8AE8A